MGHASLLIGMLFAIKFLSQGMGPIFYGEFVLGVSIAQFFQIVFFGSKFDGILRFGAIATGIVERGRYIGVVSKILVDATARCLFVGLIFSIVVYLLLGKIWTLLACSAVLYAVTSGVSTGLSGLVNALRERKILALNQGAESWIKAFLALGLIQIFEQKAAIALLGYAAACSVSIMALLIWFGKKFKTHCLLAGFGSGGDGVLQSYSKGFAWIGVFIWIQNYSDRWALKYFSTLAEVGVYSVAFAFSYSIIVALVNFTLQIAVPIIYRASDEFPELSSYRKLLHSVDCLGAFMMTVAVVLAVLALSAKEFLAGVLLGEDYREAVDLIPMLLLAGGLFAVGESKVIFLNAIRKNKLQIVPKILLSILGMVSVGLLSFKYGAFGTACAVLCVSLTYACWMWRVAHLELQS